MGPLHISMAFLLIILLAPACGGESPEREEAPSMEEAPADTAEAMPSVAPDPADPDLTREILDGTGAGPDGAWDTTMGELLIMIVESGEVTGEYPLGTIRGTIDGNTLQFTYDEGSLSGEGTFVFAEDFSSFIGVQEIAGSELVWNGSRI